MPLAEPRPLAERLLLLGLRRIARVAIVRNRRVLLSFSGDQLRLHELFQNAADEVLRAVVNFVEGRGAVRRSARRVLRGLSPPVARGVGRSTNPADAPLALRLKQEHHRLNQLAFDGKLAEVEIAISRRMRRKLGHYSLRASRGNAPAITIGRKHIERDGWDEAIHTLLHEMVHQWQDETGIPVDHGASFRKKAREVGVEPRARRRLVGKANIT